VINKIRI